MHLPQVHQHKFFYQITLQNFYKEFFLYLNHQQLLNILLTHHLRVTNLLYQLSQLVNQKIYFYYLHYFMNRNQTPLLTLFPVSFIRIFLNQKKYILIINQYYLKAQESAKISKLYQYKVIMLQLYNHRMKVNTYDYQQLIEYRRLDISHKKPILETPK